MKKQCQIVDKYPISIYYCETKSQAKKAMEDLDGLWVVIADSFFKKQPLSFIKKPYEILFLNSGEKLKSLSSYESILNQLKKIEKKHICRIKGILALGGGSIGDFAGFVASTYKRGIELVHIPTTWLACIDSSHGGKTALNLNMVKNQIGSYYFPKKIVIIKSILKSQGPQRLTEAYGELIKTYLYSGNQNLLFSKISFEMFWKCLATAINEKYKLVKKDPYEKKSIRQILNLGHTSGHLIESYYKIPHGISVLEGLKITLLFSYKKSYISQTKLLQIQTCLNVIKSIQQKPSFQPMKKHKLESLLLQDKKIDYQGKINFIFLKNPGNPVNKKIKPDELIEFLNEQGWCK